MGLDGKPAPDPFVKAAELLGVPPARTAVFEDSIAGVQSGRAAGAGLVVGIDRRNDPDALRRAGADVIVTDLAGLEVA
jgi:beta-phosphoglucomutase-like phosphatase (HAD superfamily)